MLSGRVAKYWLRQAISMLNEKHSEIYVDMYKYSLDVFIYFDDIDDVKSPEYPVALTTPQISEFNHSMNHEKKSNFNLYQVCVRHLNAVYLNLYAHIRSKSAKFSFSLLFSIWISNRHLKSHALLAYQRIGLIFDVVCHFRFQPTYLHFSFFDISPSPMRWTFEQKRQTIIKFIFCRLISCCRKVESWKKIVFFVYICLTPNNCRHRSWHSCRVSTAMNFANDFQRMKSYAEHIFTGSCICECVARIFLCDGFPFIHYYVYYIPLSLLQINFFSTYKGSCYGNGIRWTIFTCSRRLLLLSFFVHLVVRQNQYAVEITYSNREK